jgi:hypothetical protein
MPLFFSLLPVCWGQGAYDAWQGLLVNPLSHEVDSLALIMADLSTEQNLQMAVSLTILYFLNLMIDSRASAI